MWSGGKQRKGQIMSGDTKARRPACCREQPQPGQRCRDPPSRGKAFIPPVTERRECNHSQGHAGKGAPPHPGNLITPHHLEFPRAPVGGQWCPASSLYSDGIPAADGDPVWQRQQTGAEESPASRTCCGHPGQEGDFSHTKRCVD